jgi:hypothetical protein
MLPFWNGSNLSAGSHRGFGSAKSEASLENAASRLGYGKKGTGQCVLSAVLLLHRLRQIAGDAAG